MTPEQAARLRALPAVGSLLQVDEVARWCQATSRAAVVDALRHALDHLRARMLQDGHAGISCDTRTILGLAERFLTRRARPSLHPVINATGVVLHTGLGRAPLCAEAIEAVAEGAAGYTNLEYDLDTGGRGRRTDHVEPVLCRLTGAESATVVNNNAAAMVLIMRALCWERQVVVSRGELVEIGGSFRMPDVMSAGGAILTEVGTTNRTRIEDYRSAINEQTAALLRVHHSNFRIVGFTERATLRQIAECAHAHGLIAIDDLGSGALFDLTTMGLPHEPHARESIAAGADVVCFSGDKLLGGPQAGIIVGRRDLISRIEAHPLMRTYRVDKLVLLALEATLRLHAEPQTAAARIPALSMMCASTETLAARARELEQSLSRALPSERFLVGSDVSYAGGGSLPGEGVPTVVIRWTPSCAPVAAVASALHRTRPPVIVRVHENALCFDLRTLRRDDFEPLVAAVADTASDGDVPASAPL